MSRKKKEEKTVYVSLKCKLCGVDPIHSDNGWMLHLILSHPEELDKIFNTKIYNRYFIMTEKDYPPVKDKSISMR